MPPLIYAAQRLQASEKSHSTAVFGYRNVHFADEIVSSYAHRTLSIDESEGNVITLLDRMESQRELAGGLEPVVLSCDCAADDEGGSCGRPRGASNASSAWSSAWDADTAHV